jgi:hypothetical protein
VIDEDLLYRDDLAERRRERDREREPRTVAHQPRRFYEVSLTPTDIVPICCPACNGPVFAPADSHLEDVDCADPACGARLVTQRSIDGSVSLLVRSDGAK